MKHVLAALVAAVVAAYRVQKLVADAWNAPALVIWAAWLGLTVNLYQQDASGWRQSAPWRIVPDASV
jgi:hypothetical protein